MFKNCLVLILILLAGTCYAQQDYFVLVYTDNHQPFYILVGNKSYSSSAHGHLILSQLKEGSYPIKIGFPAKTFPEQRFTLTVGQKDLGFQLKNLGEEGWALFNPQTLELKRPDKKEEPVSRVISEGVKKDDAFSRLMAGVVSDTAVMYNTYAMEQVLKDSPVAKTNVGVEGAVSHVIQPDTVSSATREDVVAGAGQQSVPDSLKKKAEGQETAIGSSGLRTGVANTLKVDSVEKEKVAAGKDTIQTLEMADKVVAAGTDSLARREAVRPVHKPGSVVKIGEHKTVRNWRGIYADKGAGKKADTIVVIIPVDTVARIVKGDALKKTGIDYHKEETGEKKDIVANKGDAGMERKVVEKADSFLAAKPDTVEKKALAGTAVERNAEMTRKETLPEKRDGAMVKSDSVRPVTGGIAAGSDKKPVSKLVVVNSDCKNFATEYDVDKLRVKMLGAGKDEDRITAAVKVFRTKCFTTRQIKALSEVFTSDGLKYRFFESAYPFVSDDKFRELASLLADPVYNSKFKAMTGQQ